MAYVKNHWNEIESLHHITHTNQFQIDWKFKCEGQTYSRVWEDIWLQDRKGFLWKDTKSLTKKDWNSICAAEAHIEINIEIKLCHLGILVHKKNHLKMKKQNINWVNLFPYIYIPKLKDNKNKILKILKIGSTINKSSWKMWLFDR